MAITCAEGPVLEVINNIKADEEWPVLRDEIRWCFSENKTPVHAAALLDEFWKHQLLLLPVTHSGVSSTLQVSGRNCKLLVYLEVRDRIVD